MKVEKGQTQSVSFTAYDNDGSVRDLTGETVTLYVYRDLEGTALFTKAATVAAPTTGVFKFDFIPTDTSTLDKLYYPAKILINNGTDNHLYNVGIFNVLTPTQRWEYDTDVLTGVTRSGMITKVKTNMRHDEWADSKFYKWINDAIEDFCLKTEYNKVKASATTQYGKGEYIIPGLLIGITKVTYIDSNGNSKILKKNRDYIRTNNKIILLKDSPYIERNGSGEILGGYTFTLEGSFYAQPLANDADYIELTKGCNRAIEKYVERAIKIEDRRPAEEIAIAGAHYNRVVNEYVDKNAVDSLNNFSLQLDLRSNKFQSEDPLNTGVTNV